ncbi:MAG: ribonuclease P protein component [Gemmatimonadaceae bacterium]|nr:ribonuclease P protein component [Gemmatimonadaceae bacterium]
MTREGDLEAVRVQGKRIRTAQFEVRYLASPLRRPRVGVIVPRYSHSAVERNLVKRRLRDLIRTELLPTMAALDVVVRAAPGAYGARHDELRAALQRAMERIRQSTAENGREAVTTE